MKNLLFIILLVPQLYLQANSDTIPITEKFIFKDGIYLSLEAFQKNQPNYSWDDVEITMHLNDESLIATVDRLVDLSDTSVINLKKVWGICFENLPFFAFDKKKTNYIRLAGMRQVGKICYYSYWQTETTLVAVKAYNPFTGRPFREAKVPKEEEVLKEWMLAFEDGRLLSFNAENMSIWARDDGPLVKQIKKLETKDELFQLLKLYNQRNPVYLKLE